MSKHWIQHFQAKQIVFKSVPHRQCATVAAANPQCWQALLAPSLRWCPPTRLEQFGELPENVPGLCMLTGVGWSPYSIVVEIASERRPAQATPGSPWKVAAVSFVVCKQTAKAGQGSVMKKVKSADHGLPGDQACEVRPAGANSNSLLPTFVLR